MRKNWSLGMCLALCVLLAMPAHAVGELTALQSDWNFLSPTDLLFRQDGTLLVSDGGLNNFISIENGVSSLAAGHTLPYGATGRPAGGHLDGAASLALFHTPWAMVEWGGGVAVSDRDNHCLRLLAGDLVKTLAGDGQEGLRNGAAAQARFSAPLGLAAGPDGTLYIADSGNGCIRALSPTGQVSTYLAGLSEPAGLCWYEGALYVTDVGSHQVFRVENGKAALLAGAFTRDEGVLVGGFVDGPAAQAAFSVPFGVTVKDGVVYVADTGNSAIRQLKDGWVTTLACYRGSAGDLWPGTPTGLDFRGDTLYIADGFAGAILRLDTTKQLFQDVGVTAWYAEEVSYVYTAGLMQGTSRARFSPQGQLTRGQAVTLLHRLAGQPGAAPAAFADVPASLYCAKAVDWAVASGIANGADGKTFLPNAPVTREQLATFLYRYVTWQGGDRGKSAELSAFADESRVQPYAKEAMAWACGVGALQGTADGRLAPAQIVTRSQVAVILTRLHLEKIL